MLKLNCWAAAAKVNLQSLSSITYLTFIPAIVSISKKKKPL